MDRVTGMDFSVNFVWSLGMDLGPFLASEMLYFGVYEILKNMWFFFAKGKGAMPPFETPRLRFSGGARRKSGHFLSAFSLNVQTGLGLKIAFWGHF